MVKAPEPSDPDLRRMNFTASSRASSKAFVEKVFKKAVRARNLQWLYSVIDQAKIDIRIPAYDNLNAYLL